MMPNNIEKDIDQVIKMANSHNNSQKYVINIEDSKKMKKANKLKIKPGYIIALAIGIVIVIGMTMYFVANKQNTLPSNSNPEPIPDGGSGTIVQPVNSTEKQYIKKYGDMYGLDSDKVYDIYLNNKDYFKTINYLSTSKYEGYDLELEILTFVRHIYQKPGDFNVNLSSISSSKPILENDINEEKLVKYYADLFGIDPVLVLAMEYQESSYNGERYASDAYLSGNNPAGLIDPSTGLYWKFPSKVSGINNSRRN